MSQRGSPKTSAAVERSRSPIVKGGSPMRASILRVDSPVRAPRGSGQSNESLTKRRSSQNLRAPLAELSSSMANGATSATSMLTPTENRRLTMPPLSATLLRKASSERIDSPARMNGDAVQSVAAPSENDSPQWSSAIGHATTSGKSGRVIERLMAENDKLKKELGLANLRTQELERNLQTVRPQLEALRAENSNLSHLKSVDGSLLSRRDRKIESLKEELAIERARREGAEALVRSTIGEKDDAVEIARRDVQQAQDEAKHSTLHASILEQSHRQLAKDYRLRAERWQKDIDAIKAERKADAQKLAKLDVVANTMRHEIERARKLHAEVNEQFEKYRKAQDKWCEELANSVGNETARSKALNDEMQETVDKMKWLMANHLRLEQEAKSSRPQITGG